MMLMLAIASLTTSANIQPYLATSPPAWDGSMLSSPQQIASLALAREPPQPKILPQKLVREQAASPPSTTMAARSTRPSDSEASGKDEYKSKVAVLTTSLPMYHNEYMAQKKKTIEAERQRHSAHPSADHSEELDLDGKAIENLSLDSAHPRLQSPEEQEETAKRLKPPSLSTIHLQQLTNQALPPPAEDHSKETKKHKTRWQFGIRSRNQPHEAMHCVYKALLAQGALWETPPPPEKIPSKPLSSYPVHVQGAMRLNETMGPSRTASPEQGRSTNRREQNGRRAHGSDETPYRLNVDGPGMIATGLKQKRMVPKPSGDGEETDDEDVDPHVCHPGYIPKDPWCIHVRWRKDGLYPAGFVNPSSAHSSRQDLSQDPSRRSSGLSAAGAYGHPTPTSNSGSASSIPGMFGTTAAAAHSSSPSDVSSTAAHPARADGACYVYMDVQLYTLEPGSDKQHGTYLVDFKCAGYEALLERAVSESERALVGSGYRIANKDVTSPQPFLDLTNKLVIHLAGGGSSGGGG